VDLQNRLERDTPLHAAIKNLDDPELRNYVVENLLEAGANTKYVAWNAIGAVGGLSMQ